MLQFWVNEGILGKKWHCLCIAEACSIFSKYFLRDFIFWLAFANENAKFSKTVFIVLKF